MVRVKILTHLCKGCELCTSVCPKGVLFLSKEVNERGHLVVAVREDVECSGCGNCTAMCPDAAILILEEAEAK